MSLEAEAFILGIWDNFEEMEEKITMEELNAILEAKSKYDYRQWRFQAQLKGIDLDEENKGEVFTLEEKIAERRALEAGMSQDEYDFAGIGISVITESE